MTDDLTTAPTVPLSKATDRAQQPTTPPPFREDREKGRISYAGGLGCVLTLMLAPQPERVPTIR